MDFGDRFGDDHVACRLAGDVERLQDRDAAGYERPQRAGEPGDRALTRQVTEKRGLELDRIDDMDALLRSPDDFVEDDKYDDGPDDDEGVVLYHVAGPDDKLGQAGKRLSAEHIRKNRLEFRDDEDEQERQDHDRDHEDDDWIKHRRHDLVFDFLGLFLEFRQAQEDELQHAAEFARLDHVDVEFVKDPRVPGQALGERSAALHGFRQIQDDPLEHRIRLLLGQDGQPAEQR